MLACRTSSVGIEKRATNWFSAGSRSVPAAYPAVSGIVSWTAFNTSVNPAFRDSHDGDTVAVAPCQATTELSDDLLERLRTVPELQLCEKDFSLRNAEMNIDFPDP
jgi:hypothetical protein